MDKYMNKYINSLSKEEQIKFISKYSYDIQYIKNPCYEVQLVAIQEETNIYKMNFEFIKQYITYPDLLELLELKILNCKS